MTDCETEVIRRIYVSSERLFLEVKPGPDGFGVEIIATTQEAKDYFMFDSLMVSKEFAIKLADAIDCCAGEVE